MRCSHALTLIVAAAGLAAPAHAQLVYGLTDTQSLVTFDASNPGTIQGGSFLSGLASGERAIGIDFRPATGELFALGSQNNLYTINPGTGQASRVGSGFGDRLDGSSFGFDFNPTIDRIRVVSDADQNLVLNPITGGSTMVTDLFYRAGDINEGVDPNVVGSAYTNSVAGATTTQLYGIDTGLDVLVRQDNSAGTLDTVGALGVDLTDVVGFDIDGATNTAFAAVQDIALGRSTFWSIDLDTGAATQIDEIGGGALVGSIAIVPAPGTLAMLGLAGVVATRRRR
ncbi:hypothetical protein AY599_21175 [Leptolyngbya valderiana BDU 20041]|nr:hypothetical protein AY599_21175 [Leptolyngbya valderiana BDU 20041]